MTWLVCIGAALAVALIAGLWAWAISRCDPDDPGAHEPFPPDGSDAWR